jgi:phenylalanyl-tRNA synthetase beta chain
LDLLQLLGLGFTSRDFKSLESRVWQTGQAASIALPDGIYAQAGILDLALTRAYDLDGPVVAGMLCILPEQLEKQGGRPTFKPFSLYPPATRDLALIVSKEMPSGQLEAEVETVARNLVAEVAELESVSVFDIYEGEGVPEGFKSVACEIVFRHPETTLKDKAVNQVFQAIQVALEEKDGISIRR